MKDFPVMTGQEAEFLAAQALMIGPFCGHELRQQQGCDADLDSRCVLQGFKKQFNTF
jgi:hypothetical protein